MPNINIKITQVRNPLSPRIGETMQGGIIFYLDETKKRGLIAAPTDEPKLIWAPVMGEVPLSTSKDYQTGQANTAYLESKFGPGTAADACFNKHIPLYGTYGYKNWYLPSLMELALLFIAAKEGIVKNFNPGAGYDNALYWSSSAYNDDPHQASKRALAIDFNEQLNEDPSLVVSEWVTTNYELNVRAIKSLGF